MKRLKLGQLRRECVVSSNRLFVVNWFSWGEAGTVTAPILPVFGHGLPFMIWYTTTELHFCSGKEGARVSPECLIPSFLLFCGLSPLPGWPLCSAAFIQFPRFYFEHQGLPGRVAGASGNFTNIGNEIASGGYQIKIFGHIEGECLT